MKSFYRKHGYISLPSYGALKKICPESLKPISVFQKDGGNVGSPIGTDADHVFLVNKGGNSQADST